MKYRPFTSQEREKIEEAQQKSFILYEGKQVPHRSCGIALAETFNLPSQPYQSLRKGGITGDGECGAIKAGELILGEYLGDPDPTGGVTPELREAIHSYREKWKKRVDRGPSAEGSHGPIQTVDIICNHLTSPFEDFTGEERRQFCTNIAAEVAQIIAEILIRFQVEFEITPIKNLD